MVTEIASLINYVKDIFLKREVVKQRKLWEEDRQRKIAEVIAKAMKQWDDENYSRLLEATWGWHPFYLSFVANPLCATLRPSYPLSHSVVEAWDVHALLLQQSHVKRVYPVPWSVLLLRCFLKFYNVSSGLLSHPSNGFTDAHVTKLLKLAEQLCSFGSHAWQVATKFLKEEGFVNFAGARPVDSHEQWVADVEVAWKVLRNPDAQWWAELRMWCNSIHFRAVQDMAFHDKDLWVKAWMIRDRPSMPSPPLAGYERWLQYREDVDVGYAYANPGNL